MGEHGGSSPTLLPTLAPFVWKEEFRGHTCFFFFNHFLGFCIAVEAKQAKTDNLSLKNDVVKVEGDISLIVNGVLQKTAQQGFRGSLIICVSATALFAVNCLLSVTTLTL